MSKEAHYQSNKEYDFIRKAPYESPPVDKKNYQHNSFKKAPQFKFDTLEEESNTIGHEESKV